MLTIQAYQTHRLFDSENQADSSASGSAFLRTMAILETQVSASCTDHPRLQTATERESFFAWTHLHRHISHPPDHQRPLFSPTLRTFRSCIRPYRRLNQSTLANHLWFFREHYFNRTRSAPRFDPSSENPTIVRLCSNAARLSDTSSLIAPLPTMNRRYCAFPLSASVI